LKRRRRPPPDPAGIDLDGRRLVRIIAFVHFTVGVHAAMRLVQELLTMRVMGISESFVNLIEESVSSVVNLLLALGLWFTRPAARWLAIAWYLLLSIFAFYAAYWWWHFHVVVDSSSWPEHASGKLMPLFLLVFMFLPRVKRAFTSSKHRPARALEAEPSPSEPVPTPAARWSIASLITLLFLIVVVSNLAVDTAVWISRSGSE
jgi:hypothetical protein